MKIAIDIPDVIYYEVKRTIDTFGDNMEIEESTVEIPLHIIYKTIVLPEHHGRLGDLDVQEPIIEELENILADSDEYILNKLADLRNTSTIIEATEGR